jgi:hypothetical protein
VQGKRLWFNSEVLASPSAALGLGGDVDGGYYYGVLKDSRVLVPVQMIMLADSRALETNDAGSWEANLDPTDTGSATQGRLPSNRHNYETDIMFCDGHTETALRNDVINTAQNNLWRPLWNNDNKPHNELTWPALAPTSPANRLDPSY